MTLEEIRKNKPDGATGYAEFNERTYYFIMSSFGWRQVKGNIINFHNSGIDHLIKPL